MLWVRASTKNSRASRRSTFGTVKLFHASKHAIVLKFGGKCMFSINSKIKIQNHKPFKALHAKRVGRNLCQSHLRNSVEALSSERPLHESASSTHNVLSQAIPTLKSEASSFRSHNSESYPIDPKFLVITRSTLQIDPQTLLIKRTPVLPSQPTNEISSKAAIQALEE